MKKLINLFLLSILITGCSSIIPIEEDWTLPDSEGEKTSLLYGYLAQDDDGKIIPPEHVELLKKGSIYFGDPKFAGEEVYIFSDGKFVAPVSPGRYVLRGFIADNNSFILGSTLEENDILEVKGNEKILIVSKDAIAPPGFIFRADKVKYKDSEHQTKEVLDAWIDKISTGTNWE